MKIHIDLNETIDADTGLTMEIDPKVKFEMEKFDWYDPDVLGNFKAIVEQLTYDYLSLAGYVAGSRAEAENSKHEPF